MIIISPASSFKKSSVVSASVILNCTCFIEENILAKISEFSDAQLEKAFKKYKSQYREKATPQLKKILVQLDAERKKRTGGGSPNKTTPKSSDPSPSQTVDLSKLSQSASFMVDKTKKSKASKEKKKLSNKLSKGQGPVIGQLMTNILLGVGGVFALVGLVLVLDVYLLEMLPMFTFKTVLAFVLVIIGMGMMKVAMHLSDDNR